MRKKVKVSVLYKENLISKIKEIIEEYGSFNITEVYAEPVYVDSNGNLAHCIEDIRTDTVFIVVYNNSSMEVDTYDLLYEKLKTDTLEKILDLCEKWKEICEKQEL
jgi:hypothetical protein